MLRSRAPIEPIANDIICVLYIIHTVVCVRNTIHDNRTNLYTNGACYPSNANSFICNKITYFLCMYARICVCNMHVCTIYACMYYVCIELNVCIHNF